MNHSIFIFKGFTAQVLKVCRTPGPTACLKLLQKVCLKMWRKEKKSMTGSGQPRTCSHTINALIVLITAKHALCAILPIACVIISYQ